MKHRIDTEVLENLLHLRDTHREVSRELEEQKGKQEARQELAKKMIEIGEPHEKIASLTGLTLEEVQKLQ